MYTVNLLNSVRLHMYEYVYIYIYVVYLLCLRLLNSNLVDLCIDNLSFDRFMAVTCWEKGQPLKF